MNILIGVKKLNALLYYSRQGFDAAERDDVVQTAILLQGKGETKLTANTVNRPRIGTRRFVSGDARMLRAERTQLLRNTHTRQHRTFIGFASETVVVKRSNPLAFRVTRVMERVGENEALTIRNQRSAHRSLVLNRYMRQPKQMLKRSGNLLATKFIVATQHPPKLKQHRGRDHQRPRGFDQTLCGHTLPSSVLIRCIIHVTTRQHVGVKPNHVELLAQQRCHIKRSRHRATC